MDYIAAAGVINSINTGTTSATVESKPLTQALDVQPQLTELQFNEANTSDTEAPFWDLHISISNDFVSSRIYDNAVILFFIIIVNFPFG